ncbi:diacylglycerol/lipid kinase family protein [Nesterenkonia ebinurensis]|uniref:diacylglycerol/lipid kinase family protein n=1 Tax=Nesterenkonia ebinurensis TaxID=2608252 RepID=UPI00123E3A0E|nr:diacylglycerol kinase family protein [Nesterenkonia ebinurensis]
MNGEDYSWLVVTAMAVAAVLLIVVAAQGTRVRGLRRRVADLEQQAEVTALVAAHPKSPEERLVGVVVNVSKENADQVVKLVHEACTAAGMPDPLIMASTAEDPGHVMTRRVVDAGCDVVIAAGGDGTLRAVAAELVNTDVALGVVPLGTGNLFARNIGLPYHDLPACVTEAIHGTGHRVDTLDLRLQRPGGRTDQEISLVIAGGGLDAEVMEDTREVLKTHAGWLAYGEAGLRHVLGPRKTVGVRLDDADPETYRIRSVLLANCGTLQAGIRLIPEAKFDDGHMDVALFTPRHALDWARVVAKTALRSSTDIPVMKVRQARTGRLTMAEPMPFQIDGDAVGEVISVTARVASSSLVVNGVSTEVLDDPSPANP